MPTKRLRRGVFNICGITDVVYKRFFAVPFVKDEQRKKFLEEVKDVASSIWKNLLNILYLQLFI